MTLDKKLVLEELEEQPISKPDLAAIKDKDFPPEPAAELSEQEVDNFNSGVVADLLTSAIAMFNSAQTTLSDPNIKEDVKILLSDISNDLALMVGKIEAGFKHAVPEDSGEVIQQGQDQAQEIVGEE